MNVRGFSTLEMLIAMTVLVLAISAVILLFPLANSSGIDTELSSAALVSARTALTRTGAEARNDFRFLGATTTATALGEIIFSTETSTEATDFFTSIVTTTVSWGGLYGRSQAVALRSLFTDYRNAVGGDTCSLSYEAAWGAPHHESFLFGGIQGIDDPSGFYTITDIDVYRDRLYAAVNTSSSPLPSAGPNDPTIGTNLMAVGTVPWTTPSAARVNDGTQATAVLAPGERTHYLYVHGLGLSVPRGATILGIEVNVERSGTGVRDADVRIVRPDGTLGTLTKARATGWPASETYTTYGGSTDLWNEQGWSADAIRDPAFGLVIAAQNTSAVSRTAAIDHVRVTVTYTKQFYVLDVSGTPRLIQGLGQNTVSTGMNAVVVATSTSTGSHAYTAMNSSVTHLQIIDLDLPVPEVTASYTLPSAGVVANTVFYKNGYVFLGLANNPTGPEFAIIDVHDPDAPTRVGTYELGAGINAIYVKERVAYLATSDSTRELVTLSLDDYSLPLLASSYNAPGTSNSGFARSLYTIGDTVYLGRYYSLSIAPEFLVISATSSTPVLRASYDTGPTSANPFGIYGVIVRGSHAFTLSGSPSQGGKMEILSGVNSPAPVSHTSITLPNSGSGTALECERDALFASSVPATGAFAGRASLSIFTP